jgi:hypothetical protein
MAACRFGFQPISIDDSPGASTLGGGGSANDGGNGGLGSGGTTAATGGATSSGGVSGAAGATGSGGSDSDAGNGECVDACATGEGCVDGACVPVKRVFVTSLMMLPNFGSASEANQICQDLATNESLPGTWRAWISDGSTSPAQTFPRDVGPYMLLDETIVANDWTDLTDGSIAHAIDLDEGGNFVDLRETWTGTTSAGDPSGDDCNGWKKQTANPQRATQGVSTMTNDAWTSAYVQYCDRANVSLYCFEQ